MKAFKVIFALAIVTSLLISCKSEHSSYSQSGLLGLLNRTNLFAWAVSVGSDGIDSVYAVETDSSGNIFYTGNFNGTYTVDFDPGDGEDLQSGASTYDIFLTKLNADGTYGWTKVIAGAAYEYGRSICFDSDDNIYLGGSFLGTVDFNPDETATDNKTAAGTNNRDIYVTKFNADGSYGWTITFEGTNADNKSNDMRGIAVDSSDNLYITGLFWGTVDFNPDETETDSIDSINGGDAFLTKINADGSYAWTKTFGGTDYQYTNAIAIDSSDNVYIGGTFDNTVDFDPGAGTDEKISEGDGDIFLTKINADGSYGWTKQMGGDDDDMITDIAIDADGNICVTGSFMQTVDFDPGTGTDEKAAGGTTTPNAFVTKFNADGSYAWTGTFTGVNTVWGNSIAADGSGNLYITGKFMTNTTYPTVDFDPDETAEDLISTVGNNGDFDAYLTKLEADGTYCWTKRFGSTSSYNDIGESVVIYGSSLYLAGTFYGTVDFNPGDGDKNVCELSSVTADYQDIFIFSGKI